MSVFDDIFDFFFGWLIPEEEYTGGLELQGHKPEEEPLIYGNVKNARGITVRSDIINPLDSDDVPNDLLFIQVIWSVGDIEAVDQIYLDDEPIDSAKFDAHDGGRWVHAYTYTNGENVDISASGVGGYSLSYESKGYSYSIIRLEYDPEKMNRLPKITGDVRGRKIDLLDSPSVGYNNNYANVLHDYLVNGDYGRGLDPARINTNSFIAEKQFSEQLVYPYTDSPSYQYLMSCNVRLDCNNTLLSNVQKILKGCRGYLPYIDGEFHFVIERERTPHPTFEITDANRMSDLSLDDIEIKDHYNQVTVRFKDRDQKGKSASAVYPVDPAEHATYLAEDNGIPLERSITVETINNMYEALQMAEIILKRSRNALKCKVSTRPEGKSVNVGMVVNVSNEAFGMVQKPFIITSRKVKSSGICEFQMIEYQGSIYPWNEKEQQIIPDTNIPDYTFVEMPTNLRIEFPNDGTAQALLKWDSPHSSFQVGIDAFNTTIGNNEYPLNNLTLGTRELSVQAINGLGYKSAKAILSFDITAPVPPSLDITPSAFEVEVIPSIAGSMVGVSFELEINDVNTQTGAINKGVGNSFTLISLEKETTYYLWVRTINVAGESDWTTASFTTTNGQNILDLVGELAGSFTWIVYSNAQNGSQPFHASNNADYKYQGTKPNQSSAMPTDLTGEEVNYADYEWLMIRSEPADVFSPEDMAILDNLMSGQQFDGTEFGHLADYDVLDLSDTALIAGVLAAEYIYTPNLAALSATLGSVTAGTITGSVFKTAETGQRIVLNSSGIPMQMWNNADELTFSVDTNGTPYFAGGLAPLSVGLAQLDADVIAALTPDIPESTGGTVRASGLPASTSTTLNKVVGLTGNTNTVVVSFAFSDSAAYINQSTNQNWTAPKWDVTIRRRVNGGVWSVVMSTTTYTGTASNDLDGEVNKWFGQAAIIVDDSLTDSGHGATDGDTLEYDLTLTYNSGQNNAATLTAFEMTQPIAGGGIGVSTLVQLTDTNINAPTDIQVLQYDEATGFWINADGVEIVDTPANGETTKGISSNWAFDNVKTPVPVGAIFTDTTYNAYTGTSAGLVPSGNNGTAKYLREDGQWIAPEGESYTAGANVQISASNVISATNTTYSVGDGGLTQKNFTTSLKNKLDGIESGANDYTHPTSAGNKHLPSGGSSTQFLKGTGSGGGQWVTHNFVQEGDSPSFNSVTMVDFDVTSSIKLKNIDYRENIYKSLEDVAAIGSKGVAVGSYKNPEHKGKHNFFIAEEVFQVDERCSNKGETVKTNDLLAKAYSAIAALSEKVEKLERKLNGK